MKFIIDNWVLILLALSSAGALFWTSRQMAGLNAQECVQLINRDRAMVIDVSSSQEYAQGYIKNSKNFAIDDLSNRLVQEVKKKEQTIIFTCAAGVRAARAQAVAAKLGYTQTHVMAGGMRAWKQANLPVETS